MPVFLPSPRKGGEDQSNPKHSFFNSGMVMPCSFPFTFSCPIQLRQLCLTMGKAGPWGPLEEGGGLLSVSWWTPAVPRHAPSLPDKPRHPLRCSCRPCPPLTAHSSAGSLPPPPRRASVPRCWELGRGPHQLQVHAPTRDASRSSSPATAASQERAAKPCTALFLAWLRIRWGAEPK